MNSLFFSSNFRNTFGLLFLDLRNCHTPGRTQYETISLEFQKHLFLFLISDEIVRDASEWTKRHKTHFSIPRTRSVWNYLLKISPIVCHGACLDFPLFKLIPGPSWFSNCLSLLRFLRSWIRGCRYAVLWSLSLPGTYLYLFRQIQKAPALSMDREIKESIMMAVQRGVGVFC